MIKKLSKVFMLTLALMIVMVQSVFAVGTADAAVVGGFTTMSDNLVATVGAVAPFAIAILAVFLAWKYGRKIFGMLGK